MIGLISCISFLRPPSVRFGNPCGRGSGVVVEAPPGRRAGLCGAGSSLHWVCSEGARRDLTDAASSGAWTTFRTSRRPGMSLHERVFRVCWCCGSWAFAASLQEAGSWRPLRGSCPMELSLWSRACAFMSQVRLCSLDAQETRASAFFALKESSACRWATWDFTIATLGIRTRLKLHAVLYITHARAHCAWCTLDGFCSERQRAQYTAAAASSWSPTGVALLSYMQCQATAAIDSCSF